jgi:hypothetical protein
VVGVLPLVMVLEVQQAREEHLAELEVPVVPEEEDKDITNLLHLELRVLLEQVVLQVVQVVQEIMVEPVVLADLLVAEVLEVLEVLEVPLVLQVVQVLAAAVEMPEQMETQVPTETIQMVLLDLMVLLDHQDLVVVLEEQPVTTFTTEDQLHSTIAAQ